MFVKICGITTEDDALTAAAMGADAVGLIFAASSRRVSAGHARDVVRRLPPEILTVGVFKNESAKRVVEIANTVGLRAVQLSGNENVEDVQWISARIPNVIKAFPLGHPALRDSSMYRRIRLMVDGAEPGSGQPLDWRDLANDPPDAPYLLAGGLNPHNVAEAIATCRPWGVDVATGVEERPGHKDPVKVREFIANARAAADSLDPLDVTETVGAADSPFDWEADL